MSKLKKVFKVGAKMANKMFSGFGMGSMMMRDPFANDPFFADSGKSPFGRMDEMINKMNLFDEKLKKNQRPAGKL